MVRVRLFQLWIRWRHPDGSIGGWAMHDFYESYVKVLADYHLFKVAAHAIKIVPVDADE